jgi:hypothetical protein
MSNNINTPQHLSAEALALRLLAYEDTVAEVSDRLRALSLGVQHLANQARSYHAGQGFADQIQDVINILAGLRGAE